jgi:hypothetical protein
VTGPRKSGQVQRTWREVAVNYRRALEVLDYPVPRCLPGERDECGGTDAEHAAAYLGALTAVLVDKREHLHSGVLSVAFESAYEVTRDELAALPSCGREH